MRLSFLFAPFKRYVYTFPVSQLDCVECETPAIIEIASERINAIEIVET